MRVQIGPAAVGRRIGWWMLALFTDSTGRVERSLEQVRRAVDQEKRSLDLSLERLRAIQQEGAGR
jgi:hypothetical protein